MSRPQVVLQLGYPCTFPQANSQLKPEQQALATGNAKSVGTKATGMGQRLP